jgi:hypothetical protein
MASDADYQHAAEDRGLNEGLLDELRRTRGLSLEGLREIPERALQRAVRRLDYPDLARAREAFRLRQARNDAGVVPPEAQAEALRQLDSTRTRNVAPPVVAGLASAPAPGPGSRSVRATSAAARARSSSTRRPRG